MAATILNDAKIKNLQPKDSLYRIFDGQGYGLYLEVLPNGSKKWRQKYRNDGRYKCITLGTYPETSLKDARSKAIDQKRLLEAGKDPLTERHRKAPPSLPLPNSPKTGKNVSSLHGIRKLRKKATPPG